jgi:hypothetical protein
MHVHNIVNPYLDYYQQAYLKAHYDFFCACDRCASNDALADLDASDAIESCRFLIPHGPLSTRAPSPLDCTRPLHPELSLLVALSRVDTSEAIRV